MLGRGLRLLEDETQKLGDGETLAGEVAFRLYVHSDFDRSDAGYPVARPLTKLI